MKSLIVVASAATLVARLVSITDTLYQRCKEKKNCERVKNCGAQCPLCRDCL